SSYGKPPGAARADPKIVTRYLFRFDGRRRVSSLTMSHKPKIELTITCLTASSSARLTVSDACLTDSVESISIFLLHRTRLRVPDVRCIFGNRPIAGKL